MSKTPRKATRRKKPATGKPAAVGKELGHLWNYTANLGEWAVATHGYLLALAKHVRELRAKANAAETKLDMRLADHLDGHIKDDALAARVLELERRLNKLTADTVDVANYEADRSDMAARVRELERQLDLHFDAHAQSDWTLEPAAPNLPDPLAGCVVVDTAIEPWRLDASGWCYWDGKRYDEFPTEPTPYAPTHPAPCRETVALAWPYKPVWWKHYCPSHLTVRPIPGDASCLLGENGVTVKPNLYHHTTPHMKVWMASGDDGYPDFTIPHGTTWTP